MQAQQIVAAVHRTDNQIVLIPASKPIPVYHKKGTRMWLSTN